MSIKVLVTEIGQHVIGDIKQIENKETEEVVGYWKTWITHVSSAIPVKVKVRTWTSDS